MSRVAVITGPTATGKTRLGVLLAKALNGEVVGADSMQIYRGMDIGTAKPTPAETDGVPHHMIDVVSPGEDYSVSRYVQEASCCVDDILARGKLPILVGGTGLYIEALLSGREYAPEGSREGLREELSARYDRLGGAEMLRRLSEFDPVSGAKLHENDKKRIVRAFEVYRLTGRTISEHDEKTRSVPPRYDSCRIALTFRDRQALYSRIDRRVDAMMEAGLAGEVRGLLDRGLGEKSTAMQAIGYKEIAAALGGECSLDEAVERVKRESRRYAKRQLSWLRRDRELLWLSWGDEPDFAEGLRDSTAFLRANGIG